MEREKGNRQGPQSRDRSPETEQPNQIACVEDIHGPDLRYASFAHVTRHPTRDGLGGGRVQFFDLVKLQDIPHDQAPDLKDAERYEEWLKGLPGNTHIARYENGELSLLTDDPHAAAIIAEIRGSYSDSNMAKFEDLMHWHDLSEGNAFDDGKARALQKAAKAESERGHDDRNTGKEK